MKFDSIKRVALLLTVVCFVGLLSGCANEDKTETQTTISPTESQPETTEATEVTGGIVGENDRRLEVDYETPGVVASDAAPVNSKTLVLNGVTVEMPVLVSTLVNNGWRFYSEEMGQQLVGPKTETNVMGFSLYLNDAACLDITSVSNDADTEKPILDCHISRLVFLFDTETGAGFDFVLPGGITAGSTAADVLAIYGDVLDNESFDYVQVGKTMLYYEGHLETGLSFYFGFNEDGTLSGAAISF